MRAEDAGARQRAFWGLDGHSRVPVEVARDAIMAGFFKKTFANRLRPVLYPWRFDCQSPGGARVRPDFTEVMARRGLRHKAIYSNAQTH